LQYNAGVIRESTDSPLTPELIESLRQSGIRLDRNGRFWHQGDEIRHDGLRRALLRWLDRLPDGRLIIRMDEHRYAYLDVDDAPLLVTAVTWRGDRAFVTMNDGSEEELAYAGVTVGVDHALYCPVRGGTLEARITTPAYYALAEGIIPLTPDGGDGSEESEGGEFAVQARGQTFPIRRRSP